MSMIDLGVIFILAGVVGAWIIKRLLVRLSLSARWLPRRLLRPWPLATLIVAALTAAWLIFVTHTSTVAEIETGTSVVLVGRITEVVRSEDEETASVYVLEDFTGAVQIATVDFPPQPRSLAIVRGRIVEHAGQRLVLAEKRLSTF